MTPDPIRVRIIEQGADLPAWISAGSAVATLLIVGATAWFARNQLKDAQRTRHSQLILTLNDQWAAVADSLSLYWEYPPEKLAGLVERLYGPDGKTETDDLKHFQALRASINLAETIAVLRKLEAITTEVVYDMWGGTIYGLWLSWQDALPKLRNYTGEPDLLRAFESLALAIAAMMEDRAPGRRPLRGGATEAVSASPAEAGEAPGTNDDD